MKSRSLLFAACLALTLAGCNAILGIEKASVERGDSSSPACIDDAACPTPCSDSDECLQGELCIGEFCQRVDMDAGLDSSLDGSADASPLRDASDATPDALADADAAPIECTLPCDAKSRCMVTAGIPQCVCATGFAGDVGACMDVDECMQMDRGGCSANADCKNTEGSRVCTCKEGFQDGKGDGTECLSKCASAACDLNATCTIVDGDAKCQCTGAYSGDGKTCTYNPSCAALTCGTNTSCGLKAGSTTVYECKCQTGYTPDPGAGATFACKDIDDCTLTPSVCASTPNSKCENNVGGFNCPCISGYRKNAMGACEDIPDCPPSACAGGSCVDATNDYSCSCGAGYTAAPGGKSCVDARNDCPQGACAGGTCIDGINAYTCMCGAGYTASADLRSCVENNECLPNPCKHGGTCGDRVNDFACDCTGTGYIGKDCDTVSQGCSTGVGTACSVGVGECANTGTYRCNTMGTALECSVLAKPQSTEKCDGKDNDCDGVADQTFINTQDLGKTCFSGDGACRAQGVNVCTSDGSGVRCNAVTGTPAASDVTCNGTDDDCNKVNDEDYVPRTISCGAGECANSVTTSCVGGAEQNTTCTPRASSPEICDGKDNDCTGGVDNGLGLGTACDNKKPGECLRTGIMQCNGAGGTSCNAPIVTGVAEICDMKDNDCDGTNDNGFNVGTSCSNLLKGECLKSGVIVCSAGAGVCNAPTPSPTTEICDGKDNDCDGTADAQDIAATCLDAKRLQYCNGSSTQILNCDQNVPRQSCNVNACVGNCAKDDTLCEGNGLRTCNGLGEFGSAVPCSSGTICDTSGTDACVANPVLPIGRTTKVDDGQHEHLTGAGALLVSPVKTGANVVRLVKFGVLTTQNSLGGAFNAALYADTIVAGKHRPGALLGISNQSQTLVDHDLTEVSPQNTNFRLAANTVYWVAAQFNLNATAGQHISVYEYYDRSLQSDGTGQSFQDILSWTSSFPSQFPANVVSDSGIEYSLYLTVQR